MNTKLPVMSESKWDETQNGHIVKVGNRSEAPYRFVGKTVKYFLPAKVTKEIGGIETALKMIREGREIGQQEI
ncbi:MAG: hypothetical protein HOP33_09105 [Verrucomicrobia bacterium]|nr:hypothetical protein [Verrucomicrobiota bacterium]